MDNLRALRQGDIINCTCNPSCPGSIVQASNSTFINNRGVARLGDRTTNCCGCYPCPCPNSIITGSAKTFVDNRPVARKGDAITVGIAFTASLDTFIG